MQVQQLRNQDDEAVDVHFDYRHIVMAVDNSAHSDRGVEIGLALAQAFGSEITGSHAAKLHDLRFKQMEGGLPEQYRRESELEKQRETHDTLITHGLEIITDSFLDVVDEKAEAQGMKLKRKSVEGKNYRALLDDIESSDYDLVIMGALGLGAVRSSTIGSVCERIVRRTSRDVLVVKDPKRNIGDGPIMVAVDGSSQGYAGLKTAMLLGKKFNVDVEVVSAFDPYFHYVAFNSIAKVLSDEAGEVFKFKEQEKLHEEIIDSGLAKIYKAHLAVSEKIAAEDEAQISTKLLSGKPYEVILKHIKKRNPSLLVFGKTGVHADEGLDIGNNAENLLRLAPCHLLITTRQFSPKADQVAEETMAWTEEGEARMDTVPKHVRKMARMAIIRYAQDHGHTVISTRIVDEAIGDLLPAEAMEAMGLLTQAASKRKQKKAEQAAEAAAAKEDGAEQTFDERTVFWGQEAIEVLETVADETTRGHIKLRAEKLALTEKRKTITADFVRRVMGDDESEEVKPETDSQLTWSEEAIKRIERVPEGFMRDTSKTRVEAYAKQQGKTEITLEVCEAGLAEARKAMMGAMQSSGGMPDMVAMMGKSKPPEQKSDQAVKAEWTEEAEQRIESVPEGFMRQLTRQRIESFAGRKSVNRIDNALIDAKYAEWGEGSSGQEMTMVWQDEALSRIQRIPDFVRPMVIREVERCADDMGAASVGIEALNKASSAWEQGGAFHSENHPDQY
jgi:nucleotide-binding universal stress UspA family protein/histone H3/H4